MSGPAGQIHGNHHMRWGEMVLSLGMTAIFDVGLSLLIFFVARSLGATETVAYLAASAGPIVGMLAGWLQTRHVGGVSIIILTFILISALVSLIGSGDSRILLLKDSAITGGFGVVTLLSAIPIFPKPLMFYFGLKFATGGSREGVQGWYDLWRKYPKFRASQYLINTVWGVSFVAEALVKAVCTFALPYGAAYTINQILPLAVLATVLAWTIWFGQRQQRQAATARVAASAVAPEEPGPTA